MTEDGDMTGARARASRVPDMARGLEAAGALIWLAAIAGIVATPDDDFPIPMLVALGLGPVLATAGVAAQHWDAGGRPGQAGAVLAISFGLLGATTYWAALLVGLVAVAIGTALLAVGFLTGPARRPAAGVTLLLGAAGVGLIFAGRTWLPTAYGIAHLLIASLGLAGPIGAAAIGTATRARSTALRITGALVLAAAVVFGATSWTVAQRYPASTVTASVRAGPLPSLAIVVDTDVLADDLMALIYLASEPDVEIRAVTVSGGAAPGCAAGAAILRDLLTAVGEPAVPIGCSPDPAPGGIPFPAEWGTETRALAASLGWGLTPGTGATPGASELLRNAIAAGPVTIVSLGPPTAIATLLADPAFDHRAAARIIQMGGAVDVPGNVLALPSVEWNAAVDPGATAKVLSADVEVVLVSLDGTRFVPMRPGDIDALSADRSTPAAAMVARILDSQRAFAATGSYFAWDMLAAVATRQPDVVRTEAIPLRVSLAGSEAGRTVRSSEGRPVNVAIEADRAGFQRIFLDALLGRAK